MTDERRGTMDQLTVSIIAGPAAPALFRQAGPTTGVLASSRVLKVNDQAQHYELPPNSKPEQILNKIRTIAEQKQIEHLIICCEPERPPMAYASLFVAHGHQGKDFAGLVQLTTTAFAIDASALLDLILGRISESDGACFVAEQIEFVDHIFLGASTVEDTGLAHSVAGALNPDAHVAALTETNVRNWQNTRSGAFDFEAALNNAGWRRLIEQEESSGNGGDRITTIAYRARRPFHPERFWHFLQHDLQGVFRAKGFFWLASRMDEVGGLNLAG